MQEGSRMNSEPNFKPGRYLFPGGRSKCSVKADESPGGSSFKADISGFAYEYGAYMTTLCIRPL